MVDKKTGFVDFALTEDGSSRRDAEEKFFKAEKRSCV